jgi:Leucine-rich repeat (LRR) protein
MRAAFNDLKGVIPEEIQHLRNLEDISLTFNAGLSGSLPESLTNLKRLKNLLMSYNSHTGTIPENIGNLRQLVGLGLSNNVLTGELPTSFFELTGLELLALDDNFLSGPIDAFGALTKLGELYLEDNEFYGVLSESLIDVWQDTLVNLDLSGNNFASQRLPANLLGMNELEVLDLHGNKFFGRLPTPTGRNEALLVLSLYDNQLSSSIPDDSIRFLANLKHLDLSRNRLTSTIPESLSALTHLRSLYLGSNPFAVGTIPSQLFQLTDLRELSLKDSNLQGTISPSVANFYRLRLLDLDQNQLSGSIPQEIGIIGNLVFLLLNRNFLSGTIPASFSSLSDLGKPNVHLLLSSPHVLPPPCLDCS